MYGAPGRHGATRELHITEPDRPVLDPADLEHAERAAAVTPCTSWPARSPGRTAR